jgi:lipoprotein-releasing system permease protein
MFRPVSIYIGLRYLRARRRHQFVSFISLLSMLGIALGVIVLITVLSVVNGFDREIKKQVFGMVAPITISSYTGQIDDWRTLQKTLKNNFNFTGVAPFVSGQALLTNSNITEPAMVTGVIPEQEKQVTDLTSKMVQGSLAALLPHQFGIVLGEGLAKHLKVGIGDQLILTIPQHLHDASQIKTRFQQFTVVGIFHAGGGGFGFDAKYAFIHLQDAQKIFHMGSAISAMHINISDIYQAPQVGNLLQSQLEPSLRVNDWTEMLGDFFENIRMTKTMMFFIFILIITVAVFNLICTLVMVVKNKQADIAILRTLGATPQTILAIFVVQGAAIGIGGIFLGIVGGVTLSLNIPTLSVWLQQHFHLQLVSANVYFVNYLPSELQWQDVWSITGIALLLSLLATLYPAWNAARVIPAEALNNS